MSLGPGGGRGWRLVGAGRAEEGAWRVGRPGVGAGTSVTLLSSCSVAPGPATRTLFEASSSSMASPDLENVEARRGEGTRPGSPEIGGGAGLAPKEPFKGC